MTHPPVAVMDSPIGPIAVYGVGSRVSRIEYGSPSASPGPQPGAEGGEILRQLRAYFADPGFSFSLSTEVDGTDFQRRVWRALCAIPAGETRTYGELAAELGTAPRALGHACRANPVPIVVPCHRVVAADGLGGFSGATSGPRLAAKRWLLTHEGALAAP